MFINSFYHSILAEGTNSNLPFIIVGIIAGVIVLSLLGVLLYFLVIKRLRLKKQVSDLMSKYSTAHGLLFGDVNTLIKRLETISNLNIVYINDFGDWQRRYKDIRDISDATMSFKLKEIKHLLDDGRVNELTDRLVDVKQSVNEYCDSVNNLYSSLKAKFEVENRCNELLNGLKSQLRQVKIVYNNHVSELNLVVSVFENVFKRLDELFEQCEADIEGARYEEAKKILESQVEPAVNLIQENLAILPEVCLQLTNVLPDNITSLKNRFEELTKEGLPLYQACSYQLIQDLSDKVAVLSSQVKTLKLTGVQDEINNIHSTIDEASRKFDEELSARDRFVEIINQTDGFQQDVSKEHIRLTNTLTTIREIYLIDAEDDEKLIQIGNLIEKTNSTKRNLDSFINSATKQPFTVLLSKVLALKSETAAAKEALDGFMTYLFSLKRESEEAMEDLAEYYLKVRDAESLIDEIRIESVTNRYIDTIDNLHNLFDELNHIIHTKPINVKLVEARHQQLLKDGQGFIDSVNKTLKDMNRAETAIVIANRHRAPNPDVDATIKQSENFFFDGDFEKSIVLVTSINTLEDQDPTRK